MNKRIEDKYFINYIDSEQVELKLNKLCKYCETFSQYNVRSLYFDDVFNKAFYDKEEGISQKEKFRIRVYNTDFDNIYLECKSKQGNIVSKERCPVSKEIVNDILENKFCFQENYPKILKKFYLKKQNNMFLPKVIIEYDRTVFNIPFGNTRITIDKNIKGCYKVQDFYNKNISGYLLQDRFNILEIKYSGIFPSYLTGIINLDNLEKINYSKYYEGRKALY